MVATLSKPLVSSSNISNFGRNIIALAKDNLAFCPPDSKLPLSPIMVSTPDGRSEINSLQCDKLRAVSYTHLTLPTKRIV